MLSVSVESLETFAETGEITENLKLLARFLDEGTLEIVRGGLGRPVPLSVATVDHLHLFTPRPLCVDARQSEVFSSAAGGHPLFL